MIVKPKLTPRKIFRLSKTRSSKGDLAHRVADKMVPTAQLKAPPLYTHPTTGPEQTRVLYLAGSIENHLTGTQFGFQLRHTRPFGNNQDQNRLAALNLKSIAGLAPAVPKQKPVNARPRHTLNGFQWSEHTILQKQPASLSDITGHSAPPEPTKCRRISGRGRCPRCKTHGDFRRRTCGQMCNLKNATERGYPHETLDT